MERLPPGFGWLSAVLQSPRALRRNWQRSDLFTVTANGRLLTMIEGTECRQFYRGPIFPATRAPNGPCGTGVGYEGFGAEAFRGKGCSRLGPHTLRGGYRWRERPPPRPRGGAGAGTAPACARPSGRQHTLGTPLGVGDGTALRTGTPARHPQRSARRRAVPSDTHVRTATARRLWSALHRRGVTEAPAAMDDTTAGGLSEDKQA